MMRNRYIGVILLVALGLTVSQQLYSREIADDDEVFRIQNQLRRELIAIKDKEADLAKTVLRNQDEMYKLKRVLVAIMDIVRIKTFASIMHYKIFIMFKLFVIEFTSVLAPK
uniref:Uncharacterized protein n=1 Tax=Magallana gigas TaxID=29159 RepID=K1PRL1_MAGGI